MIQIAVPSRESDAHYEQERHDLERAVSEVNGEHGLVGHPAIHYLHKNLPFDELIALYLAADIMLVTPFKDGMNLVAKEYVMTRSDLTGKLILSEFAGAATELRGAYMVNPHDTDGIKESILLAMNAGPKETRDRMARMRRMIFRRNVYDWAKAFLAALALTHVVAAAATRASLELVDQVGHRVHDARRLERVAPHLLGARHAREDEDRAQSGLGAGLDVGVHAVTDHDRRLGVRVEDVEALADHDRVRFAHEVRRHPGRALDHRGQRAAAGQRTVRATARSVRDWSPRSARPAR